MESKADETLPTPPPFLSSGGTVSEHGVRTSLINSPVSSPPPPLSSLPEGGKRDFGRRSGVYFVSSPPPSVFSPLPGETASVNNASVWDIHSPGNPPPLSSLSPLQVSRPVIVSYETRPLYSPALATCASCQTQVTTEVTFKVGTYTWLMCLLFVLCGLFLGCCLIPFFVNHFKDAYHTCPSCKRVLHIQRRQCFK
ncbi:cell death-inducing p53-target protein 1 isoform X2 [Austrofundulus limnaeus]|uniref:Cell death-inducing p53-target protein 1 isoform X2 n=1 Tax=Austrofundulus limnaeus TaxID=52670 RepID=A0A2I4BGG1_AUSLI|nr:PREDICTED: cell death-inducing p53-target protein 1-like isoform X2 [Austrofundulus limnaeus]